jgi:membrane-associated phospholipid phosphatase
MPFPSLGAVLRQIGRHRRLQDRGSRAAPPEGDEALSRLATGNRASAVAELLKEERAEQAMECPRPKAMHSAMFLVLLLMTGTAGLAQSPPLPSPYEPEVKSELLVIGLAGGAALAPLLLDDNVDRSCPCDASSLNRLDRATAGRRSNAFDRASYVPVILAGVAPAIPIIFGDSKSHAFADALITGEAVLVNVAINQWVKVAVERPRPFLYGLPPSDPALEEAENYMSFYSQHTSVTFAAAISFARTFALRRPQSKYKWVVYSTAIGTGVAAGTMRVLAGKHFPTDVLTGAAAGAAIGLTVPWLRSKPRGAQISVVPMRSGATFSVVFSDW